ncbi:P-loop containing nucleoside triphosphate hydrolase protein [Auricularia subglabra TFB-10046 SS5]|nr:P-loop containing nucleoside triphosphate hydrolase protein [Auricularia subglabra TFB-10046 SS5]
MSLKLQSLVPNESPALLAALHEKGVRTGSDLLAQTPKGLFKLLPAGLATIFELECLQTTVALKLAPTPVTGNELLTVSEPAPRGTGLDALLGTLVAGDVFEIAGPPGTGKTALAMTIVARELCALPDAHALWIDSRLAFNPERMLRIIQSNCSQPEVVASVTERVQIVHARDLAATYDALGSLGPSEAMATPRVVVIDGITELLLPGLNAKHAHGNALMTTFVRYLATLARTNRFTALVINSSVPSDVPLSVFPGANTVSQLGVTFAYLTAGTLWLNDARAAFAQNIPVSENTRLLAVELLRSNHASPGRWELVKLSSGVGFTAFDEF